jgi:DNA-binding response OmpR family regulator
VQHARLDKRAASAGAVCDGVVTWVVHDVRVRVLVVEDHEELARAIAEGLRDRGIATDLAYDGTAALQKGLVYRYDVIVLDRDLPGIHGDAVCMRLRDRGSDARILMLTAAAIASMA